MKKQKRVACSRVFWAGVLLLLHWIIWPEKEGDIHTHTRPFDIILCEKGGRDDDEQQPTLGVGKGINDAEKNQRKRKKGKPP
jgi:hypothetical protein